jgi:mannose-6-phosphate isomerase-like protein (cupin superfamily)
MQPETARRGTHYALTELGPPESWNRFVTQVGAPPGIRAPGKAFLAEALHMTGMEISANVMRPGGAVPFLHRHRRHEETYVILSGRGEMQIDGEIIALHPGSVVCIKPDGERCWRNTGDEPMHYLVIQAVVDSLENTTIEDGFISAPTASWPP